MRWWVWATIALVAAAVAAGVVLLSRYRPPKEFVFATGREDGAYYAFAVEYQERLAAKGYTMSLLPTSGSVEILERIEAGQAVVGFVQGGTAQAVNTSELLSLGSVFYEPLWIFYRKAAFAEPPVYLKDLRGSRIAVGEPGSGSALLARQLLTVNGVTEETSTLVPIGIEAASELLDAGELDVALFVMSPMAATVQTLLTDPTLTLLDIGRTLAYQRRFPYLTTVTLGEGSVDLAENIPDADHVLLATTTSLVARRDISPDITRLILSEAQEIHGRGGLLEEANEFPSTKLVEIEMNTDASRFLDVGPTGLERYLPYWLSSRLEWFIFVILPLLVVLYPIFRNIPVLFSNVVRMQIFRWYRDVRKVERQIPMLSVEEIERHIERLEELHELLTKNVRVPLFYLQEFYDLRVHLNLVIQRLEKRRDLLLARTKAAKVDTASPPAGDEAGEVTPAVAEPVE
jgi:TRAP transporter TAXI family solute receptor